MQLILTQKAEEVEKFKVKASFAHRCLMDAFVVGYIIFQCSSRSKKQRDGAIYQIRPQLAESLLIHPSSDCQ